MTLTMEDSSGGVSLDCLSMGYYDNTPMIVWVHGHSQQVMAFRGGLNANNSKAIFRGCGLRYGKPCSDAYKCHKSATLPQYHWWEMLFVAKDPRLLVRDDERSLEMLLKRHPYTTPLKSEWVPYIKTQLEGRGLLVKLMGHEPRGSILTALPDELDEIVSDGLKSRELLILR